MTMSPSIQSLQDALANANNPDLKIRRRAIATLLIYPQDSAAIQTAIAALASDKSSTIRALIADKLGHSASTAAIQPLIAALKDKSKAVRESAAYSLGYLGAHEALEPLLQLLQDARTEVRRAALSGLEKLGDIRASAPLLQYALAADPKTFGLLSFNAARALSRSCDDKTYQALLDMLNNASYPPFVRSFAQYTLMYMCRADAIEPLLIAAQQDPEDSIRRGAVVALTQFQEPRVTDFLVLYLDAQVQDALKPEIVSNKRQVLLPWPLKQVIETLGKRGDARIVQPLTKLAAYEHFYWGEHHVIIKAFGQVHDPAALAFLLGELNHFMPSVIEVSARVLAQSGNKQAIEPLRAVLARIKQKQRKYDAREKVIREALNQLESK